MLLDTHKQVERLIATGVSKEAAEAFVEVANEEELDTHLAVKKLMAAGVTEATAEVVVNLAYTRNKERNLKQRG